MIAHILIMDDQPQEIEPLHRFLSDEGYKVSLADTASGAKRTIRENDIDLVLLDVDMLSKRDIERVKIMQKDLNQIPFVAEEGQGFEVAAWTRSFSEDVGVIMLTNRDTVQDRVGGLDRGADDYIAKGQEHSEIAARIRALLKRRKPLPKDRAIFADIELNLTSQKLLMQNGDVVQLTEAEFKLLRMLVENPRKILSRGTLYREVHHGELPNEIDRAVDTLVSKIRKKVSAIYEDTRIITTVHGKGYRLEADVEFKS